MTTNDFLQSVRAYIKAHELLSPDDKCLVALSGGADSVALLICLQELGYTVEAVHCNFKLRGEESDRDETFCMALCKKRNITLHKVHFDTRSYARLHKVSIEMAARTLRYGYFEQLRQALGFTSIAVAHHRDDNAETVLMNLARGTGLKGLCGIRPHNGFIIRPLLCVAHADILRFLDEMGQNHVEDSTNAEDEALRNRIRHKVIPALEEVNPAAVKNICKTAERLSSAWTLLKEEVSKGETWQKEANGSRSVKRSAIGNEYALWFLLSNLGFSSVQVEEIYSATKHTDASGQTWQSATHLLTLARQRLQAVELSLLPEKELKLPITGTYDYGNGLKLRINETAYSSDYVISKDPLRVCLDADKVRFPLTIRPLRSGDRFVPFGMKGSKLVSDFLTDRKFSQIDKRMQLAVCDEMGEIVWLAGLRPDNRFRITSETKRVLEMSLDR